MYKDVPVREWEGLPQWGYMGTKLTRTFAKTPLIKTYCIFYPHYLFLKFINRLRGGDKI